MFGAVADYVRHVRPVTRRTIYHDVGDLWHVVSPTGNAVTSLK